VLPVAGGGEAEAEIHFSPEYAAGYAWYFPKKDTANVGLALDAEKRAQITALLDDFVRRLAERGKISGDTVLRKTGGPIPVGGPPVVTRRGNMLLVGDAAGQTDPLTGAGIHRAVVCGTVAGKAAARSDPSSYEAEWRDLFLPALRRSLEARRLLTTAPAGRYESALRKAWKV